MAHDIPTIQIEPRDRTGTRYAKRLRKTGRIPAVIYGHGQDPVSITLDRKTLADALHSGAHLLNIELQGQAQACLVKDVQMDHLGDVIIHADLTRVDLTEEVEVEVELVIHGRPKAMDQAGAVLNHPLSELTVRCAANNIPDRVVVDVSKLTLEDVLTVADLKLPEGVVAVTDEDALVAQIQIQEEADDEPATEATEGEPEIIGKKDGEEGDEA